jgi:hypothetical protein
MIFLTLSAFVSSLETIVYYEMLPSLMLASPDGLGIDVQSGYISVAVFTVIILGRCSRLDASFAHRQNNVMWKFGDFRQSMWRRSSTLLVAVASTVIILPLVTVAVDVSVRALLHIGLILQLRYSALGIFLHLCLAPICQLWLPSLVTCRRGAAVKIVAHDIVIVLIPGHEVHGLETSAGTLSPGHDVLHSVFHCYSCV